MDLNIHANAYAAETLMWRPLPQKKRYAAVQSPSRQFPGNAFRSSLSRSASQGGWVSSAASLANVDSSCRNTPEEHHLCSNGRCSCNPPSRETCGPCISLLNMFPTLVNRLSCWHSYRCWKLAIRVGIRTHQKDRLDKFENAPHPHLSSVVEGCCRELLGHHVVRTVSV